MDRTKILSALDAFIESRPGFDPANYQGYPEAYRSDSRRALRHLHDARILLGAVMWRDIDAAALIAAKHHRIEFKPSPTGNSVIVDYCTGSYFPIEYRAAACATLSTALWNYFRDKCGCKSGDEIRDMAKREVGRSLARRWFV